jgi:hypothetical protein
VNDYVVAAHESRRSWLAGQVPEVKHHAHLIGAATTACGFGLHDMRVFKELRFSDQVPSVRWPLCARVVGAADR